MWLRGKAVLLILLGCVLLSGVVCRSWQAAFAQDGSSWVTNVAPNLSKTTELPSNTLPASNNVDCRYMVYAPSGELPRRLCTFASPLGSLTADGYIMTGENKLESLYGSSFTSVFIPTVDSSMAVMSVGSRGIGNYVGVYRHITKSMLLHQFTASLGSYYEVDAEPDALIRDPATNNPLEFNIQSIAYSANGEWMVADMPHVGLVRVNMHDLSIKLFAGPLEPSWFLGLTTPPLAISNDGQYVAANTDIFGQNNLNVYDLATCTDQLDVAQQNQRFCAGKNIWLGQSILSQPMGHGLVDVQPGLIGPTHFRFINDSNISFSARYDVVSPANYKAANFVATIAAGSRHGLSLLGMGDSYISGQGEFDYKEGTDTDNNICHLSLLSYPFTVGQKNFNSYNSVACSGATIDKLIGSNPAFTGQVRDGVKAIDRDKQSILANFSPGYIYQQEFAAAYQPEAILLSVGGDDIGFADIVKACVANSGGGTCYATYEDRAELVNEVNGIYSKLVNTYTALQEQSGDARLYVVGYPQIAKPGGDCGLNVHLNSDEVDFSAQLITYLDGILQRAAQTAGVSYVDTQQAFDGHRLCEAGDKAVNGLTAGTDAGTTIAGKTINFIGAESYHPTQLGHQLLAQTIARETANLTTSMPEPTTYNAPVFDPTLPLLLNTPHNGREIRSVTNDTTIATNLSLRGNTETVQVDGTATQLQPGSAYQVVLHSDPILLAQGTVDADGNILTSVHMPADITPGYHTLHVYATNMAGQDIDIQKALYVGSSADDYDGDGMVNSKSPCLVVPASKVDVDMDGVDDACDPEVTAAPASEVSGRVSATGTIAVASSVDNTGKSVSGSSAQGAVLGDSIDDYITTPSKHTQVIQRASRMVQPLRLNWERLGIAVIALTFVTALCVVTITKVKHRY